MLQQFTGWKFEDEEKDFEIFSTKCCGSVVSWSGIEEQLVREAQNPFETSIDEAVADLASRNLCAYEKYVFGVQETNDCGGWGTANAVDVTRLYQIRRGIEGIAFRTSKVWNYSLAKYLAGDRRDNGMSISLAMQHISQHGVLPDDLPGMPRYSASLQKQVLRNGGEFYESWKDKAILCDIQVVKLPMDFDAWLLFASTGRMIVYGTRQSIAVTNGECRDGGSTNHCMTAGGRVRTSDKAIMNVNSWPGESWGFMKPELTKRVISRGLSYGSAFGIWNFAPREAPPNYSGIGKN